MRLVFVHGMRQEGKLAADLEKNWEDALISAWRSHGLSKPTYTLEMPFYGDLLNQLVEEVRGSSVGIVSRGDGGPGTFTTFELDLIREMGAKEGVTDADIKAELGQEVVARGFANWEWVQAIARILERNIPNLSHIGLSFVRQVDGYLTRPHIRAAVDNMVRPSLLRGPTVVVAHSLGTIVAYRLLREADKPATPPAERRSASGPFQTSPSRLWRTTRYRAPHPLRAAADCLRGRFRGLERGGAPLDRGARLEADPGRGSVDVNVPLFVTVGSPLGIDVVKQHLRPPALTVPVGITKWLNGTDERDYVALYARLDRDTFIDGIENVSDLHNGVSDPHAILDYLSDSTICKRIHAALQ